MQNCKTLENLRKSKEAAQKEFSQRIQDLKHQITLVEQKMEETMSNFQHDISQLEEAEKVMEDQ
eukprot:11616561-Karenia_brevis.AAC.1